MVLLQRRRGRRWSRRFPLFSATSGWSSWTPAELVFVVLPSLAGAAYPRASLRIIASSACEVKIRSNSAENYKVNPNPVVVAPGDQVAIDIAMTRDFRHLKTLWSQHRWQIEARALHDGRVEKHVIKASV